MYDIKENEPIGKCIVDASHQIKLKLNALFDSEQLTGQQARILAFISQKNEIGESVYQKDIEKEFKINGSSVTTILKTLEKNGFIDRKSVCNDARLKMIELTSKAVLIREQHRQIISQYDKQLEDSLSAEEAKLLRSLLCKIVNNANSIEIKGEK